MSDPKQQTEYEQDAADLSPPEAGSSEAPGPDEATGADPGDALQEAEAQAARYKDAMLRMQADMENLRKRMARELESSRKLALASFMSELLPVRDSLERGLEMADEQGTVEALREGKALTMKMLTKVLADNGLEEIDPRGEPFNPEFHEAMSMLPSDTVPADTVMEVIQKGYRLHDRLIRPARVVVSRGPAGN